MKFLLVLPFALGLLFSLPANADHARKLTWTTRYPIIGRLDKPKTLTGGLMLNPQFGYGLPLGKGELRVGGELGVFGFGAPGRWLGILGGARADIGGRPIAKVPLAVVLTARISAGRIPVITAWGFPMNYSGLYPGAALALSWEASDKVRVDLGVEGLFVSSYSWTGIARGPLMSITGSF